MRLELPAQDLSQSLIELGTRSELSIVFPTNLTIDKRAPAIRGNFTPRQALNKLLEAQPLRWRELSPRVVALSPIPADELAQGTYLAPALSEIVVIGRQITGSRIQRLDLEGSAPVDIISRPELLASGVQTISDYLKFIPAVAGNSTSTAVSNGGDGTATITLRGLPASNTLVLINGHRTANSGLAGESVDLNSIPLVAVERLEVLKDGASAIYGSDAIAGVVNIILRDDYEGVSLEHYRAETSRHDMETRHTGLVSGFTWNNTNVMLTASRFNQGAIFSRDRDLAANADGRSQGGVDNRSTAAPSTFIALPSDEVVVLDTPAADPSDPNSFRPATEADLYNYRESTSSLSPSERTSVYLSAVQGLTDVTELVTQAGFTETDATVTFAPYPLNTAFEGEVLPVGANNPYNPFGVELYDLRRRLVELGPRLQHSSEKVRRFSMELQSSHAQGHWDLGINWNQSQARKTMSNLVDLERVGMALSDDCVLDSECVPLNLFGPPGAIDQAQINYILDSETYTGQSKLYELTANADALIDTFLPGPLGLAGGVALRREIAELEAEHVPNATKTDGGRRVEEIYVEAIIPLALRQPFAEQLELELASRYSHYSDFGGTNNPKIGLRYRPVSELLLRSTHSRGFRAPSLYQMHQDQEWSYDFLDDPCTRIHNVDALVGCSALADDSRLQFLTVTGGNEELKPERSTSLTLGAVWTPRQWPNIHFSVDWFRIDQEDVIGSRAQYVLDQNARTGKFPDQVLRDAAGNLLRVFAYNMNVGSLRIEGFDTSFRYRWHSAHWGNFVFSLNGSHLHHYQQQLDTDSEVNDLAGVFADDASEGAGSLPRWKINGGVSWRTTHWEVNYNAFYVSALEETIPFSEGQTREIESWITQNLQFNFLSGYQGHLRLTLGVENILDRAPPFAASAFNDNFDARTYEIKGRTWYGQLRYQF